MKLKRCRWLTGQRRTKWCMTVPCKRRRSSGTRIAIPHAGSGWRDFLLRVETCAGRGCCPV